jgi:hypothetical protein
MTPPLAETEARVTHPTAGPDATRRGARWVAIVALGSLLVHVSVSRAVRAALDEVLRVLGGAG